ncbi:NAC domain-containing protein 82-like isoform X2 [Tasmannia lanceolata]|uniref:NAC domain-containing protein 82-like isoform X2 n=1 Tax=Tasmannia lanceolata TaxID=3420 RepID=UPI004064C862
MTRGRLPPGFRFRPTDEELVKYYLKRKVMGKSLCSKVISEIDLYKFDPWDLPEKSCLRSKDLEWYFFSPRNRKYGTGPRIKRATDIGFWKTTGEDVPVCHNSRTVGMRRTLVFYIGRAPRGRRTDWVMHEYRLEDQELVDAGILQDAYVLCKIFQKSGRGPKNGEHHGAPFEEEEWDDDSLISFPVVDPVSPLLPPVDGQNIITTQSAFDTGKGCGSLVGSCSQQFGTSGGGEEHSSLQESDDLDMFLRKCCDNDDDTLCSQRNGIEEERGPLPPNIILEDAVPMDDDERFSGLEDIPSHAEHNTFDGLRSQSIPEGEHMMQEMHSGVNDGFYLELKDLQFPIKADDEYGIYQNLYSPVDNWHGASMSDPEPEIDFSKINTIWECQEATGSSAAPSVQLTEVEKTHVLQPLAGDSVKKGSATSDLR